MERDAIISLGSSSILLDRLKNESDKYDIHVCNSCGQIALYKKPPTQSRKTEKEAYCSSCMTNNCSLVRTTYAFKLILQYLKSMNILPRIITED